MVKFPIVSHSAATVKSSVAKISKPASPAMAVAAVSESALAMAGCLRKKRPISTAETSGVNRRVRASWEADIGAVRSGKV